jgi:hypothetical protein
MTKTLGVKKNQPVHLKFRCPPELYTRIEEMKTIFGISTQQLCVESIEAFLERDFGIPSRRMTHEEWLVNLKGFMERNPELFDKTFRGALVTWYENLLKASAEWADRHPAELFEVMKNAGAFPVLGKSPDEYTSLLLWQAFIQQVPEMTVVAMKHIVMEHLELFRASGRKKVD